MNKDYRNHNNFLNKDSRVFIIAEMSGNHNQSLSHAIKIVEAAAKSGVDAIKLQTYTADTMTIDSNNDEFLVSGDSIWKGRKLYDIYKSAHTPWEWHKTIFKRATELGLIAFSTPFDSSAVDFLESLNVPCYKVSSFENTDINLIKKIASTGKPMIISSGMATISELGETVDTARKYGCNDITLLKCTSTYPASPEDSNILTIPHMKSLFNCRVGLSDHTLGVGVAVASVALGATVIEKHFTLDRMDGGIDSLFSLEPDEFSLLVSESERASVSLGHIKYGPGKSENNSVKRRRSIYITENLVAGDKISHKNIKAIRPGYGLPTKYMDIVIGMRVLCDVKHGSPLTWDLLK